MTASKSAESSLEAILAVRRTENKVEKDKSGPTGGGRWCGKGETRRNKLKSLRLRPLLLTPVIRGVLP